MEIAGKTPINPWLFISGKLSGYLTWIFMVLDMNNLNILPNHSTPLLQNIAILPLILGILLIILSSIYLGSAVRIGLPDSKTELKQSGIYRISRNPMYLGLHFVTIAALLFTMNVIIIIMGVYSFIIYNLIILKEEEFLERRFGDKYLIYKKNVHRYF